MKVSILNCKEGEIVDILNLPECQNGDEMLQILYSTTIAFLFEAAVSIIGKTVIRKFYGDGTKQSKEGNSEKLKYSGPRKRGRKCIESEDSETLITSPNMGRFRNSQNLKRGRKIY